MPWKHFATTLVPLTKNRKFHYDFSSFQYYVLWIFHIFGDLNDIQLK